jgi:hypothetical protein
MHAEMVGDVSSSSAAPVIIVKARHGNATKKA